MAGSRVVLAHRNLMGTGFQLTKITYYLDGAPVYVRRDDGGGLDQQDELVIFDGNLAPGRHVVGVELIYKGKGFGRFSYLRGYTFQASATHEVDVGDRGAIKVVSVGFAQPQPAQGAPHIGAVLTKQLFDIFRRRELGFGCCQRRSEGGGHRAGSSTASPTAPATASTGGAKRVRSLPNGSR